MKAPMFSLALAAALVCTLTACGGQTTETGSSPATEPVSVTETVPVQETSPAPETSPAEPPVPDAQAEEPVPDFLTPEQQDLYRRARIAAGFLMGCNTVSVDLDFPLMDGSAPEIETWETVTLDNGWTYLISAGRYQRWDDFQAMLDGLFTREYQETLLNFDSGTETIPLFTALEDGRMIYLDVSRGSNLEYDVCGQPDSFALVEEGEDEIVFDLIGHYASLEEAAEGDGVPQATGIYTQHYPIRMERTADGWRFSEFHVAY